MEKPPMCYWVKNKTWKNLQCVTGLKIIYGTINTNTYHIIPFTVKKMKLFLLICKHKCMSILRKMSGRIHTKLIMVFTSREGTKIGCDSQGDFRYRYNSWVFAMRMNSCVITIILKIFKPNVITLNNSIWYIFP